MDAAEGTIAKVVDAARDMLAATSAFRTWDGASWTVDQAKARIYRQTMPLYADLAELATLRPFAVLWVPVNGVTWRRQASPAAFRARGSLVIEFHRAPAELDDEDPGAVEREFANFLGKVARTGDPSSPGLCDLSGTAGYLQIAEIRSDGIYRAKPEDVPVVGDCDLAFLEVDWD